MHSLCSYVPVKRVILLRPPAPREAGRDCPALCVLLSYSLICALLQPNFFATNQRAQDGYTHTDTHTQGRIHTHLASLACVVSCWRLVACFCRSSASCSGVCCRRLAASLCLFARSLCVCGRGERQSQCENYDDDAAKTLLQPNLFASNQREQDG